MITTVRALSRAVVPAVVLAVAGCAMPGGGAPTTSTAAGPSTAVPSTLGALTAQLSATARASGYVHLKLQRTADGGGGNSLGRIDVEGDLRFNVPRSAALSLDDGTAYRYVVVGSQWYVRTANAATPVEGASRAKPWLGFTRPVDAPADAPARYDDSGLLTSVLDPQDITGLTVYGTKHPVQRVSATAAGSRYLLQLTPAEWIAAVPEDRRGALQEWAQAQLVSSIDVQLEVDPAGRLSRQILDVQPNSAQVTVETDYTRWGTPVTISPPPPGQVGWPGRGPA